MCSSEIDVCFVDVVGFFDGGFGCVYGVELFFEFVYGEGDVIDCVVEGWCEIFCWLIEDLGFFVVVYVG